MAVLYFDTAGYHSVHLAAALELEDRRRPLGPTPLVFVSADLAQRRVAELSGLQTADPNAQA